MTTVSKNALVRYSAAEMYALVNDVESYPQFLPWCRACRVVSREPDAVRATLDLARGGIEKSFTTLNRLHHDKMIEIHLVDGPFRRLNGFWRFDPLGDQASKVSLDMDFEFAPLLDIVLGPVFHPIANSLVDAFHKRAVQIYGKR